MRRLLNWKLWGGLMVLFTVLYACVPDTEQEQDELGATHRKLEAKPTNRYYHLEGTLDSMAITMELIEETDYHNEYGRFFRGFYRYDLYGGPIAIYGNLEDDDQLVLTEQGGWDNNPHTFQGQWDERGYFSGQWLNGNGVDAFAFSLEPGQESVPLECWVVEDSIPAFPHWTHSPTLFYGAEWLRVQDSWSKPELQRFLDLQIAEGLLGEGYAKDQPLPSGLEEQRNDYLTEYKDEMISLRDAGMLDSLAGPDAFLSMSYNYNSSVQVYFNSPELLTVGYTDYSYLGGAHGIFGTKVKSYDLNKQSVLELPDVLKPGYEQVMKTALERAVRIKYGLKNNQALDAILFEKEIQANDNFGVTDKGIFFVYTPYEIAPYAAGEIELFVSFEQISEYVQDAWLPMPEQEAEQ